ncbi:MAG: Lrp/AsnC family transcriptional regulator [Betaproteobacteria bacterium]
MRELTAIDVQIIKELLKDGRKSFSSIAQECKTSKDIIWKHYKELKKAGVIVGASIQMDCRKLGYSGVATISISLETQNMAATFERLKNTLGLGIFRYYNTSNTLTVLSILKDLSDLQHAKEIISKQNKINEIRTNLWLDVRNIPENMLNDKAASIQAFRAYKPPTGGDTFRIDSTDLEIIEKLAKNGRMPFSKIAKEMALSTNTIVRHYEKLVKNNVIKVSIQINPLEIGFQAILESNLALSNQSEINEIADRLTQIPGVSYIVKLGGNYDLMVVALVKDCKDIIAINDEIVKIPNIKKIEAALRQIPQCWPGQRQYISTF